MAVGVFQVCHIFQVTLKSPWVNKMLLCPSWQFKVSEILPQPLVWSSSLARCSQPDQIHQLTNILHTDLILDYHIFNTRQMHIWYYTNTYLILCIYRFDTSPIQIGYLTNTGLDAWQIQICYLKSTDLLLDQYRFDNLQAQWKIHVIILPSGRPTQC